MSAVWRAVRFTAALLVVWVAATLTGPTQAFAEPLETTSPVCQPNTVEVTYTHFGAQNIPIKLQVWLPNSGSNLPAVVMVHLGSWKNGSKCSASINNTAPSFRDAGFVVFAIDYRLTSDPGCADPTIDDPNLCLGPGDGTIGTINEPVDDLQAAILWVRQNHSTCAGSIPCTAARSTPPRSASWA